MTLSEVHSKISSLRSKVERIVVDEVNKAEPLLRSLIQQQLAQGQKAPGVNITPSYVPPYARKKKRMGSSSSPVPDLKVSGGFWNNIEITGNQGLVFQIESKRNAGSFNLAEHLEKRYTSQIYELTPDNYNRFINSILTKIDNRLTNEANR